MFVKIYTDKYSLIKGNATIFRNMNVQYGVCVPNRLSMYANIVKEFGKGGNPEVQQCSALNDGLITDLPNYSTIMDNLAREAIVKKF